MATMPEFMDFEDESEKAFFRTQALILTALTGLTDFGSGKGYEHNYQKDAERKAA